MIRTEMEQRERICMCVSQDACQCDGTAAERHTIMYQMKVTLALQSSSRCLRKGYENISSSSGDRCELQYKCLISLFFKIVYLFILYLSTIDVNEKL